MSTSKWCRLWATIFLGIGAWSCDLAFADYLKPMQLNTFDDRNSVAVDWTASQPGVVLHVFQDGVHSIIDIVGPTKNPITLPEGDKVIRNRFGNYLPSRITSIVYRDSRSIWIFASPGPANSVAILVDLSDAKVLKEYFGRNFSLSPDRMNLAYIRTVNIDGYTSVLVNDTIVSPVFSEKSLEALENPPSDRNRTERRRLLDEMLKPANTYRLDGPIVWKDNSTIEFVNRLADGEDILHNYRETISFPAGEAKSEAKITSQTLKVERVHISPADAQAMLDQARGRDVPR